MPSQNKTAINFNGLNSYSNPLSPAMPAGAMLQANNVRLDRPGSITPRPGQSALLPFGDPTESFIQLDSWLTQVINWNLFYQNGDGLYPSWLDSDANWFVLATNIESVVPSTQAAPVYGFNTELFNYNVNTPTARGVAWNTNQYVNFNNGVGRIHVQSGAAVVEPAGIPQAMPVLAQLLDPITTNPNTGATISYSIGAYNIPVNGSAIPALGVAAYYYLYMRTDYDNTILLGPPSEQVQVNNAAGIGTGSASAPIWSYTGSFNVTGFSASAPSNWCVPAVVFIPGTTSQVTGVMQCTSTGSVTFVASPEADQMLLIPGRQYAIAAIYNTPSLVTTTTVTGTTFSTTTIFSGAPNTNIIPFEYMFTTSTNAFGRYVAPGNIDVWQTGGIVAGNPSTLIATSASGVSIYDVVNAPSSLTISWLTTPFLGSFVVGAPLFIGFTGLSFSVVAANESSNAALKMLVSSTNTITSGTIPLVGDNIIVTDVIGSTVSTINGAGTFQVTSSNVTASIDTLAALPAGAVVYSPIATGSTSTTSWNTNTSASTQIALWAQYGAISYTITWNGPRNVFLQFPYDQWLHNLANTDSSGYEAFSYQVYRSVNNPTIDSTGTVPLASAQAGLLTQALLPTTSVTSSTTLLPYFDQVPSSALGTALYTDPTQEGALAANFPPPPCADLTLLNGVMLYANIAQPANMQLQLVGVSGTASTTSFRQMQPGDEITVTYIPATNESTMSVTLTAGTDFALVTSSDISTNLNQTVINFCNKINEVGLYTPQTGSLIAFPSLAQNQEPGLFVLAVTQGQGVIQLYYDSGPNRNILTRNQASGTDILTATTGFVVGTNVYGNTGGVATIASSTAQAWQGARSLFFNSLTAGVTGPKLALTLAINSQYTFSFYLRNQGSSLFNITARDSAGNILAATGPVSQTNSVFTRHSLTFTTIGNTGVELSITQAVSTTGDQFYIDGLQLETGSSTTQWILPGLPTVSHPVPFVGIPASGAASPTLLPSYIAYSQANIPDGVPITNTIAVGTTTYPIRRILTCQAGTFIFKDDGLFQFTGTFGNFSVNLLTSSARLVADNTAVVFQDSVMALTTAGAVIVNTSGIQIISQAIREDLLTLMKLSSIKYAFAVTDQQRSHYMLWMCSNATLTQPDICYVYNTLNNTWTLDQTSRQVGIVELETGTLYMGMQPTSSPVIGLQNAGQVFIEYAEGTSIPVVAQVDDLYGTFNIAAGPINTQFVLFASFSYQGVGDATALAANLQTALSTAFTNGAALDSSNNAVPILAATWTASTNTTSSTITVTGSLTTDSEHISTLSTMVSADSGGLNVFVGAPIPISFQVLLAGDDPGHVKTFQEFTLQARNTTQLNWTTNQSSDFGSATGSVKLRSLSAQVFGSPAQVGWAAATTPSANSQYVAARNFVAKNVSRGHVLFTTFAANVAATTFEIIGLTFNWSDNSTTQMK